MAFNHQMSPVGGDAFQHYSLPSVHLLSSASSPADKTEERRLPPLPRFIEPVQRDLFNPFAYRGFVHSPASTQSHDSSQVRSPWQSAEHIVAPPSPANSADSWTSSMRSQQSCRYALDHLQLSNDDIMRLLVPRKEDIRRTRKPLQQQCGRKRKGNMMNLEQDNPREKHRVAEGKRRKALSDSHGQLEERLDSSFLEQAGWNPAKSQSPSKEQILGGTIFYMDTVRACLEAIYQAGELPSNLAETVQPQFRCMQLEKMASDLQQQANLKHDNHALDERNRELEERNRALEYKLKASEHNTSAPRSEQPSMQHTNATLPALRLLCDEISAGSPGSSRYDVLSPALPQSFGPSFPRHTPPATGPSSPAFHQASYSMATSRTPSLVHSPPP
ncbi:hypothetical protein BJX70DRAFT_292865 [Aspergillus crustosus]